MKEERRHLEKTKSCPSLGQLYAHLPWEKNLTGVLARASRELSGVLWAFLIECLGDAVTSFEDAGASHYGIWTSQDLETNQEENTLAIQSWS